jgi:catechol 2,3-dioxygenase-like lactoylglutathione lyase family enzyme
MKLKPKNVSIVFYVSDIARTETFYNQTLGLQLERQEGAEPFWLQAQIENGPLRLWKTPFCCKAAPNAP